MGRRRRTVKFDKCMNVDVVRKLRYPCKTMHYSFVLVTVGVVFVKSKVSIIMSSFLCDSGAVVEALGLVLLFKQKITSTSNYTFRALLMLRVSFFFLERVLLDLRLL